MCGFGLRLGNQIFMHAAMTGRSVSVSSARCALIKKRAYLFSNRLGDKRRYRISNQPELMRARDRKFEPVRETLDPSHLAGRQRTTLGGMNKSQTVFA